MSGAALPRAAELAAELVRRASVTPQDAGCMDILRGRLEALGFCVQAMPFGEGEEQVQNLWAWRNLDPSADPQEPARPCLGLVGHTDVVPTGPEQAWSHPPFSAHTDDTYLWGRGAADMKGGLAALVTACEAFLGQGGGGRGSLAFLVTSDEEGPAVHGIAPLAQDLAGRGLLPDWCLIGEPSSEERCADQVRIGRRGSLNARMEVLGLQGHVAYPERVRNPIHAAAPFLAELAATAWDQGTELFPPTSLQVSNIHSGTGAANVVPSEAELRFNFRFSPASSEESLRERVEAMVGRHGLDARLHWQLSAAPFYTAPDQALVQACVAGVTEAAGEAPHLSTSGGTSDGRFLAPLGAQVVELGPRNYSIHAVDERVELADLQRLEECYLAIFRHLLG